jgi:hypothetical protein
MTGSRLWLFMNGKVLKQATYYICVTEVILKGKACPLQLFVLQTTPRFSCYTNWQADLRAGWLNIALPFFHDLQTTFGVPQYTNWHMGSKAGGLKIAIVYGWKSAKTNHILHLHHIGYIKGKSMSSIVLCPTNNIKSSMIYKLTGGLADWLAQNCTSIVLCPPNITRSFAIYKSTDGL